MPSLLQEPQGACKARPEAGKKNRPSWRAAPEVQAEER